MKVEHMYEWMSPMKTITYTVSFRDSKKQVVRITGHRNDIFKSLISKGIDDLPDCTKIVGIFEIDGVLSTKKYVLGAIEQVMEP
jgi:hypothetical protein